MPRAEWRVQWHVGGDACSDPRQRDAWHTAWQQSDAHVFQRLDVIDAWQRTIGKASGARPVLVHASHDDGSTVGLAAVAVAHHGRAIARAAIEAAGQEQFGYHDPLVISGKVKDWDGYWDAVRRSAPDDTLQVTVRLMHPAYAGTRFAHAGTEASPVLRWTGMSSGDEVLAGCSANHRGDVRRRLRRLGERGPIELEVFTGDRRSLALQELVDGCWPAWCASNAARGWTTASRPGMSEYCQRLATEGLAGGWAHFSVLRVSGEAVAWHLGLADRGRLYWWLPVHAARWAAFSPGKVLLARLVDWLVRERWRELHFLTGEQPYKLAWMPEVQHLSSVRWYATSARGRLVAGYDRVMRLGRQVAS